MERSNDSDRAPRVPRCISSEVLLMGERELLIRHGEKHYRLLQTSKGKLILTK